MEFSEAARLLSPDPLPLEMGVERLASGQLHVAVRTYLIGCTGAMFQWWFGSGPNAREYAWWHPVDHVGSEWLDLPADGSGIGSTHVADERLADDVVHSLKIRSTTPSRRSAASLPPPRSAATSRRRSLADIGLGAEPPRDEQRPSARRQARAPRARHAVRHGAAQQLLAGPRPARSRRRSSSRDAAAARAQPHEALVAGVVLPRCAFCPPCTSPTAATRSPRRSPGSSLRSTSPPARVLGRSA